MSALILRLPGDRLIPISNPRISSRPFEGDRLVKVRLYGRLAIAARQKVFELAISSVREAITALHFLTEQRTTKYIDSTGDRVRWRVLVNGTQIDGDSPSVADELMIERKMETIDIYPVMEGAGTNILGLILGAVLIVVAIVLQQYHVAGWIVAEVALAGVASVLGGLLQLLERPSSTPKQKSTKGTPSYLFSGTVNTQTQGGPVPVAYGNVIVGSQCIGATVSNSDLFMTIAGSNADYKISTPFMARDVALKEALAAVREGQAETRQIQTAAATTPWNELGSVGFWGYVAQVTVVPYQFNVQTSQQPPTYDNGPQWLLRAENGALWANYTASGNTGPWDSLREFPQELDSIVLTQMQDSYIGWAATPNLP